LPNIEEELRQYQSHIRQAIRQCRANGQAVVVMTQPTLYRENLPADLESLTWVTFTGRTDCAYTSKALAQGMSQINAATKEVCEEENAACLDLVPVVPQDTSAFCDHCHLNNGGCEIVAGALADFIVQHDILHQPSAKTPWP
jgi:hypothetical protein